MTLLAKHLPTTAWVRTCQECFHRQADGQPGVKGMSDSYRDRKCRKCKSESLDYGTSNASYDEDED